MIDKFNESFKDEAFEMLENLEVVLMILENDPAGIQFNKESIDQIFRIMHTIKGTSAMFGFEEISHFTHQLENLYDLVRGRKLVLSATLIEYTLQAGDMIKAMITQAFGGDQIDKSQKEQLVNKIKEYLPADNTSIKHFVPDHLQLKVTDLTAMTTFRIRFRPPADIFLRGYNLSALFNQLMNLSEIISVARSEDVPGITEINPELCYTSWDIILTTDMEIAAIRDVFIFIENDSELKIETISIMDEDDHANGFSQGFEYKRLGEILVEKGDVASVDLEKILNSKKRLGDILVDESLTTREAVESALWEQEYVRKQKQKLKPKTMLSTIRVKSEKLDSLMDMVGELVAVKAKLSQTAKIKDDPQFITISEEIERITDSLYESAMDIRMLPIGTIFDNFKRLVRDLCRDLNKEAELFTEGAATELDKTVMEKLNDPLVHLIRNCIDHGIEKPDDRVKKGKNRKGLILLQAQHSGANIIITIKDDGAGLDSEKILKTALTKGLVKDEESLTEAQIHELILRPGFSTMSAVSQISGRGVGLDVVKKTIDNLGGSLCLQSEKDKGAAITLQIPVTLSIIEGLLVKIGDQFYVIPLSCVQECIELPSSQKDKRGNLVNLRGEILPFIRLREFLKIEEPEPEIQMIVVITAYDAMTGLVVDHVIGGFQVMIKPLGAMYRTVENLLGAAVLGDGSVALILDVNRIVKQMENREAVLNK